MIELDRDYMAERCSIHLPGLAPYIKDSNQPEISAEGLSDLAAAAWHVTKLSWSPDASHIIVIRRPDPTQVLLSPFLDPSPALSAFFSACMNKCANYRRPCHDRPDLCCRWRSTLMMGSEQEP